MKKKNIKKKNTQNNFSKIKIFKKQKKKLKKKINFNKKKKY